MINARAETVATKHRVQARVRKRRCIIPADGFYEWQKLDGTEDRSSRGSSAAATASRSRSRACGRSGTTRTIGDDAPRIRTCVIITTDANELVQPIHDRMPVVLPESAWDTWLDRDNHDVDALQQLLVPAPADELEAWPVVDAREQGRQQRPRAARPSRVASSA